MQTSLEIKVRGYHLDVYGHVNNARYLEFLEEARWDYLEQTNVSIADLSKKGFVFAIVNININYRYPATLGDILVVETEQGEMGNKKITMNQRIFLKETQKPVSDAVITFVVLDAKTQKALPVEGEVKKMFICPPAVSAG